MAKTDTWFADQCLLSTKGPPITWVSAQVWRLNNGTFPFEMNFLRRNWCFLDWKPDIWSDREGEMLLLSSIHLSIESHFEFGYFQFRDVTVFTFRFLQKREKYLRKGELNASPLKMGWEEREMSTKMRYQPSTVALFGPWVVQLHGWLSRRANRKLGHVRFPVLLPI